jgi:hypothetical protein
MLDLQLNFRNLPETGLIAYLQAVSPEAALCPLAGAVAGAVADIVALGPLNSVNQLGLLQISRIDTEVLGLFLYLGHCYCFFPYLYRTHFGLLITVWLYLINTHAA